MQNALGPFFPFPLTYQPEVFRNQQWHLATSIS